MDRRERYNDPQETMRAAMDGQQAQVWTALPCIVQSFDATALTVTAQPAVKGSVRDGTGAVSVVNLPVLVDVPVCFPRGGGVSLTFPVRAGDECLVVFASRCIDGWWKEGGVQQALDSRMHDLSDGFAIVGPWSQAKKINNVSTAAAQLRTDDGATLIALKDGKVTIQAQSVVIDSPEAHFTGKITAVGDILSGTISLQQHVHTGVRAGTDLSSVPKP